MAWVQRLPRVVAAANNQVTRLIGLKPVNAIKRQSVFVEPATAPGRPVGTAEKRLPADVEVRYLFAPGELEGGTRRATYPFWFLKTFTFQRVMIKPDQPVMYWLHNGPKRSFVREELMVFPPDTELSPTNLA